MTSEASVKSNILNLPELKDIIDDAKTRRGIPTINHKRGNQVAVLSGDYLFAREFELLST